MMGRKQEKDLWLLSDQSLSIFAHSDICHVQRWRFPPSSWWNQKSKGWYNLMNVSVSKKYSETLCRMSNCIFMQFINFGNRCFLSLELILVSLEKHFFSFSFLACGYLLRNVAYALSSMKVMSNVSVMNKCFIKKEGILVYFTRDTYKMWSQWQLKRKEPFELG